MMIRINGKWREFYLRRGQKGIFDKELKEEKNPAELPHEYDELPMGEYVRVWREKRKSVV